MKYQRAACVLFWVTITQAALAGRDTWLAQTSLPQQARLSDVAGVGTVVASTTSNIVVQATAFWLGNPGTNTLSIATDELDMPVVPAETSIVFFATTNIHYRCHLVLEEQVFTDPGVSPFHLDYPRARTHALPSRDISFFGAHRGWFPADESGGQIMNFASNLVHVVRLQPDVQAYYQLLRNHGAGWTAPERIAQDVRYSLWMSSYHDGPELLALMAADEDLDPRIRGSAAYRLGTLTPEPEEVE